MLVSSEERFERIVRDYLERPAGDYAELLHRGYVSFPEGADAEAWRAEIRRQARPDRVRVITRRGGAHAFAMLTRAVPEADAQGLMRRELERGFALQELVDTARRLGHDPLGWLRSDEEYVSLCRRCGARIYAHLGARVIEDGEALSARCRHEPT